MSAARGGRVEERDGGDGGWTAPLWFNQSQTPAQRPGPRVSGWTRSLLVSLALVFLNQFNPQQRSLGCVGVTVDRWLSTALEAK